VGVYSIKPAFQRSLRPLEDRLVEAQVHPDVLTLTALGLSLGGGAAFALADRFPWVLALAPVVALARTALNALDGLVAKRTGKARPWGEVLNEFSDRLADVALLAGLAASGLVNGYLATAGIVAVLLGSYLGILSKAAGGRREYGGVLGKADRMLLLAAAGPLTAAFNPRLVVGSFFALVLIGSLITIAQRGVSTYVALQPRS
jgi:CDP-diacylglycerol--glycerol-3-phosphate 3-phosphatidyltransferase